MDACHQAGTGVIQDVVHPHLAPAAAEIVIPPGNGVLVGVRPGA